MFKWLDRWRSQVFIPKAKRLKNASVISAATGYRFRSKKFKGGRRHYRVSPFIVPKIYWSPTINCSYSQPLLFRAEGEPCSITIPSSLMRRPVISINTESIKFSRMKNL